MKSLKWHSSFFGDDVEIPKEGWNFENFQERMAWNQTNHFNNANDVFIENHTQKNRHYGR